MKKVLIDADYANVSVDTEKRIGMIDWKGSSTFEQYTECFNALLNYQENNSVLYYLSDIRKQGVVNPKSRQWFENVAVPKAIKGGLLKSAVVTEANIFKRYYLNLILQTTNKMGLPLRLFDTIDEAVKWLNE